MQDRSPGTWYRLPDTSSQSTHIFGVYRFKEPASIFMLKPCALRMYPLRHLVPGTWYLVPTIQSITHVPSTQYHKTKLTSGILLYTVFILCTVILFDYRYIPYPVCMFGQVFAIFGLSQNSQKNRKDRQTAQADWGKNEQPWQQI